MASELSSDSQQLLAHAQSSMQPFQHIALPATGRFIRLIHLLPDHHSNRIRCRLVQEDLDHLQVRYTAVSYTWGPASPQRAILLDDVEYPVRSNLYELLQAFRHPSRARIFWIDALCIDQMSLTDRNHQVSHMGEIFARAKRVNAWLGRPRSSNDDTLRIVDRITHMSQDQQMQLSPLAIDELGVSLHSLEKKKYWSRAWIVQELMLAKDVAFFLGRRSVTWDQLMQAVSMVDKSKVPYLRTMINAKYACMDTLSFEELFAKFGHLECADIRDKFYSLHGIMGHQQGLMTNLPDPDYGLCITAVFLQHLRQLKTSSLMHDYMGFAQSFVTHVRWPVGFQRDCCSSHAGTILDLSLRYHGEFRQATPESASSGSGGSSCRSHRTTNLVLHADNDIYRFRQFGWHDGNTSLRPSDRAFRLNDQCWYLVHRRSSANDKGKFIGLVYHHSNRSSYIDIAQVNREIAHSWPSALDAGRLISSIGQNTHDDTCDIRRTFGPTQFYPSCETIHMQIELGLLFTLAVFIDLSSRALESTGGPSHT